MIKRKPGRPRKVEQSVDGIVPEKRKPGRPRKNVIAENVITAAAHSDPAELFEYRISTSNGYGTDIKKVRANSVAVEEGKLILRYGSRVVGAFSTWDDLIEMEQPQRVDPMPKAALSEIEQNTYRSVEQGITGAGQQSVQNFASTGWDQQSAGSPGGTDGVGNFSVSSTNGTFSGSGGELYVLTTGRSAPHIEIIEAERPE